jgi:two-component system, NtrC family, nitrogen regulation sensor histidine kinase NtrY
MAYSRFAAGVVVRAVLLCVTFLALAWVLVTTHWVVTAALLGAIAVLQTWLLIRLVLASNREVARFLDALSFDDASQNFSALTRDPASRELGEAMTRIIGKLHETRREREEQARTLQTVMAHVPVALIALDPQDQVEFLNPAAHRLFEMPVKTAAEFSRFGEAFAADLMQLKPGETALLRLERASGPLHLKAAATEFAVRGSRRRIVSLQNIASELSAQELAAWQTVIRTMAHEVMNSLTPLSSLSATARDVVREVLAGLPADDPNRSPLGDAAEALETVARRSEGLLHFVQNHRRLTHRLTVKPERLSVRRVFVRLHSLLAADLEANAIAFRAVVEPETLEVTADADLLDQALINLLRNALEELRGKAEALIVLSGRRDGRERTVISVADNGRGVEPALRDKVFAPFYSTKPQGSGVGLTLVRHIATVHGAAVTLAETPGGGASFSLHFP